MTRGQLMDQIEITIAEYQKGIDADVEAAKKGVWTADRINLTCHAISIYRRVLADLGELE